MFSAEDIWEGAGGKAQSFGSHDDFCKNNLTLTKFEGKYAMQKNERLIPIYSVPYDDLIMYLWQTINEDYVD